MRACTRQAAAACAESRRPVRSTRVASRVVSTDPSAWLQSLPDALAPHTAVLQRLIEEAQRDERIRVLVVGCSIGRGVADELSDIDTAGCSRGDDPASRRRAFRADRTGGWPQRGNALHPLRPPAARVGVGRGRSTAEWSELARILDLAQMAYGDVVGEL